MSSMIYLIDGWMSSLFTASIYGGIVLGVMALAFWAHRLPAQVECWVLRFGCVKLLLMACVPVAIGIPLLPTATQETSVNKQIASGDEAAASYSERVDKLASDLDEASVATPDGTISQRHLVEEATTTASEQAVEFPAASDRSVAASPAATLANDSASSLWRMFFTIAFVLWCVGLAIQIARHSFSWARVRRLRSRAIPLKQSALIEFSSQISKRLGLRRPPRLMMFRGSGSPRLIGTSQPCILIPDEFIAECSLEEAKLVIGHELAHVVRRDLFWNWVVAITQSVFFFHPLVWWAARRIQATQEMACDYVVLSRLRARVGDYANLLLKIMLMQQPGGIGRFAEVGASGRAGTLEERLQAMKRNTMRRPRLSIATWIVVIGVVALLLPWKLVARPATAAPATASQRISQESQDDSKADGNARRESRNENRSIVTRSFSSGNGNSSASGSSGNRAVTASANGQDPLQDRRQSSSTQRSNSQQRVGSGQSSSSASSSGSASSSSSSSSRRSSASSSGDGGTIRSSSSSSDVNRSVTYATNGDSVTIKQRGDRITVEKSQTIEGEKKTETFAFDTLDAFREKMPNEFKRFQQMTSGTASGGSAIGGDAIGGAAGELNPAQQMMLENLRKMREENADNPQMAALIDRMIADVMNSIKDEDDR